MLTPLPSTPAHPTHHCAPGQSAFVLSIPRRAMSDETQETLRTSTFPSGARPAVHAAQRPALSPAPLDLPLPAWPSRSRLPGPHWTLAISASPGGPSVQAPALSPQHPALHHPATPGAEHVKEKWAKDLYIAGIAYGRTVT